MKDSNERFYDLLMEFRNMAVPRGLRGRKCPDELVLHFAELFSAAAQVAADERINERILFITNEIERAS